MKLAPTGVGAEPKKLAILGAILALAGAVYWFENRSDSPTVSASATPPQAEAAIKPLQTAAPAIPAPPRRPVGVGVGGGAGMEDFRPTMKIKDDLDVSKIDPRIPLDLLAKVRAAPLEGGSSSLFEFSKAPEPPAPKVDPIKPGPGVTALPPAASGSPGPKPPPGPPPPPPIPFKYYGYAGKASDGQLEGFFREGDVNTGDIFPVREGETIKNRYKIVRIGIKSAVVEDTTNHNQQTLELLEAAQ